MDECLRSCSAVYCKSEKCMMTIWECIRMLGIHPNYFGNERGSACHGLYHAMRASYQRVGGLCFVAVSSHVSHWTTPHASDIASSCVIVQAHQAQGLRRAGNKLRSAERPSPLRRGGNVPSSSRALARHVCARLRCVHKVPTHTAACRRVVRVGSGVTTPTRCGGAGGACHVRVGSERADAPLCLLLVQLQSTSAPCAGVLQVVNTGADAVP